MNIRSYFLTGRRHYPFKKSLSLNSCLYLHLFVCTVSYRNGIGFFFTDCIGSILSCSGVEMNTDSHEVTSNGQPVELTNREFILLRTLMENKNVAMTREKLLCDAWGYDYYGETNIIDVYVRYIRHKTSDDVIKTIRGVGYIVSDN